MKISVFLLIGLLSFGVQAKEHCDSVALLAESIMESRQEGVDMKVLMKIGEERGGTAQGLSEALTRVAYTFPRLNSPEAKKRQVENFRNGMYSRCIASE